MILYTFSAIRCAPHNQAQRRAHSLQADYFLFGDGEGGPRCRDFRHLPGNRRPLPRHRALLHQPLVLVSSRVQPVTPVAACVDRRCTWDGRGRREARAQRLCNLGEGGGVPEIMTAPSIEMMTIDSTKVICAFLSIQHLRARHARQAVVR